MKRSLNIVRDADEDSTLKAERDSEPGWWKPVSVC